MKIFILHFIQSQSYSLLILPVMMLLSIGCQSETLDMSMLFSDRNNLQSIVNNLIADAQSDDFISKKCMEIHLGETSNKWDSVVVARDNKEHGIVATKKSKIVAMLLAELNFGHYTNFFGNKLLLEGKKLHILADAASGRTISFLITDKSGESFFLEDKDVDGTPDIIEVKYDKYNKLRLYIGQSEEHPIAYIVSRIQDNYPLFFWFLTETSSDVQSFYVHKTNSEWIEYVFDNSNKELKAIAKHENVPGNLKQVLLNVSTSKDKATLNFTMLKSDSIKVSKLNENLLIDSQLDWSSIYTKYDQILSRSESTWKKSRELLDIYKPFECVLPKIVDLNSKL